MKSVVIKCLYCKEDRLIQNIYSSRSKYCSIACQQKYQTVAKVEKGTASPKTLKKYLLLTYGNVCSTCKITEWNGKSIVLELEHIDGNSENNDLSNLCLLCPNCHSQTDTYKGKTEETVDMSVDSVMPRVSRIDI